MASRELMEEFKNYPGWQVTEAGRPKNQPARIKVPAEDLPEAAALLKERGAFLLTMAAADRRPVDGCFAVYPVLGVPTGGGIVELEAMLDPQHPVYPALTPVMPSAHWLEREIKDLFGITPPGAPGPPQACPAPGLARGSPPFKKGFPVRQPCAQG